MARKSSRSRRVGGSGTGAGRSAPRSKPTTGSGPAAAGPTRGAQAPGAEAAAPLASRPAERQVPQNFHALYDRGERVARGVAPAAARGETSGHHRLAAEVDDVDVQYDAFTGQPNFVATRQPGARLSRAAAPTPEAAVTAFVNSRADMWGLTPEDAAAIEVVSVSQPAPPTPTGRTARARPGAAAAEPPAFSPGTLRTVNMIQRIGGVEVFSSDVTAAVDASNNVLAVSGQFFPGAAGAGERARGAGRRPRAAAAGSAPAAAATSAEEAIARAAFDLTGVIYGADDFAPTRAPRDSGPHYRFYAYRAPARDPRPAFERPVRLKDVLFPLSEGQFVPAYYFELWISGFPAFSYVMDAVDTPDVLFRKNLTSHVAFTYHVHNTLDGVFRPQDGPAPGSPHPTGKPDGFQAPTIGEVPVKIESLLPGRPWLPASARTTDGNNCIAYADLKSPNGFSPGDVMGEVTAPRVFGNKYNHAKPASDLTNLQSSLAGMFFHVNWLHDRWYEAGFDEASGNAQKSNFGLGGLGGDPILAEGNDFSGTDNANMSTPPDGSSPRMQMFEFKGPSPKPSRTSNHEALITFHEMGHYITNRLVGNASGLLNAQGQAMGEGWGDFFAACMTSQATDDFAHGVFAVGGWTDLTPGFKDNYYFSIRRYPYSADMAKNPLTFKHIANNVVLPVGPVINANPAGNNEVHNAGEVWCTALWEVFVNLVAKHGHAVAEKRMLAYVIGGLKLTPPQPTFTLARDAIITAVTAMDAADLPTMWAGFAKRGMGKGAVSPPANSSSLAGVVESFQP
jgi:extracellular elastinolytic metalloproteinase